MGTSCSICPRNPSIIIEQEQGQIKIKFPKSKKHPPKPKQNPLSKFNFTINLEDDDQILESELQQVTCQGPSCDDSDYDHYIQPQIQSNIFVISAEKIDEDESSDDDYNLAHETYLQKENIDSFMVALPWENATTLQKIDHQVEHKSCIFGSSSSQSEIQEELQRERVQTQFLRQSFKLKSILKNQSQVELNSTTKENTTTQDRNKSTCSKNKKQVRFELSSQRGSFKSENSNRR